MSEQFFGDAGSAFQAELPPPDDRQNFDTITCIARWNLILPEQHPFWNRYTLCLVHLRDCAALSPAKKESPDKTHEISVFAIDPNFSEENFQKGCIGILEPVNHVCQFSVDSDLTAFKIAREMVQRLVDGNEFAEPSGIRGARERFKDSVEDMING